MDKQISYMTLIGVHSTMHLMYPQLMSCNCYVFNGSCVCYTCMHANVWCVHQGLQASIIV